MIMFTRVFTRPNTSVPFHHEVLDNTEYKARLIAAYINTEKLIAQMKTFSDDELVMTYTAFWKDRASFDEYDSDPVLIPYWTARDAYCAAMNIILGPQTFEEVNT